MFLFSSHQLLTKILEDPSKFDFGEDDPKTEGGGIWEDDLHTTADVYDVLTVRLMTSVFAFQGRGGFWTARVGDTSVRVTRFSRHSCLMTSTGSLRARQKDVAHGC